MNSLKKVLSMILAVAMLASLMAVPAMAADPTVTLGLQVQSGDWEIGDNYYTVKVTATSSDGSDVSINAGNIVLSYNSDVLELDDVYTEDGESDFTITTSGAKPKTYVIMAAATPNEANNYIKVALTDGQSKGYNYTAASGSTVCTFYFCVKSGSESCKPEFGFTTYTEAGGGVGKSKLAYATETDNVEYELNATATATATVKGVTPTINTVTLDKASVTADATNNVIVNATAKSVKGTDITKSVNWSVAPENKGVSINTDGVITVDAKATAGNYTITATGNGTTSLDGKDVVFPTLTVNRNGSVVTTVTINSNDPTAEIPGIGAAAKTVELSATVTDQYGDALDREITWAIVRQDTGVAVDGVSIAGGVITITSEAAGTILDTNGLEFTITASVGEELNKVEGTNSITIKRAASVATSVEMYNETGSDEAADTLITIPVGSENKSVRFTAKVFDQYNDWMKDETVEWSIEGALPTGVSRSNGAITVAPNAAEGVFNLVASHGNFSDSITITVSKLSINWAGVSMDIKESPVYGDTNAAIVTVTGNSIGYDADGNGAYEGTLTGEFSIVDADTIQGAGENKTITVKFTASDDAANGEYKNEEFTYDVTVNIAKKEVVVSEGITAADKVYDGTTAVTLDAENANITGKVGNDDLSVTATGAFADKNVGTDKTVNISSLTLAGTAKDNYVLAQNGQQTTANANITAKEITVSGITAANKEYDKTTAATLSYANVVLTGKVGNDELTVSANGAFEDEDVANGKTVTLSNLALGGAAAANYALAAEGQQASTTANITAKPLTVTAGDLKVTKVYDGTTNAGEATGALGLDGVIDGDDVTVTGTPGNYADANVGEGKAVTISGLSLDGTDKNNYSISATEQDIASGEITKANLTAAMLQYEPTTATYDGTAKTVSVSLKSPYTGMGNVTVKYDGAASAINAKTYAITVTVAAGDNFNATAEAIALGDFTINPKSISGVTVKGIAANGYEYTGSEIKPEITVKDGETTLVAGADKDYTVAYSNNVNVSESAKITITGKGNYTGTKEVTFKITKTQPKLGADKDYNVTLPANGAYTGVAKTATVDKRNENIGAIAVKYNGSTTVPVNVGTYAVTVDIAESANYAAMSNVEIGSFTISKAELTITGATIADKTYNGETTDANVTAVTFGGLVNSETLTLGTDFTATGVYANANAGEAVNVTVTVALKDTAKANNYNLATATYAGATGKVNKTTTTLSITAADAVYTGVNYAESNITKTSNVNDAVSYTYYSDEACENEVMPKNVGTYWVKGNIDATTNASAAEAKASFKITAAPLTITAKDKSITYGDAPANAGVSYEGLVNSEVGDSVISGELAYDYNYEQFGNVGDYTITPKGVTAANYSITFKTGKLTVAQKVVDLTWSEAANAELYYDGEAQSITATATGTVNSDEIAVTVVGGANTEIGNYTAKATALTGAKAANYKLPADGVTLSYKIVPALTSVTVTVTDGEGNVDANASVTATIDGLTIKVVGYVTEGDTVTVSAPNATVEDGKLSINGAEYTIDTSGVVEIPVDVNIDVDTGKVIVTDNVTAEDNVAEDVVTEITNALANSPVSEGLDAAAAAVVEDVAAQEIVIPEEYEEATASVDITVNIVLNIEAKEVGNDSLKLKIEPQYQVTYTYKDENGTELATSAPTELTPIPNRDIKGPMTIKVKLPDGFEPNVAKHALGNGQYEYLHVTIDGNNIASWQQSSFSEVELIVDSRAAAVSYEFDNGSKQSVPYTAENIGAALPTDSKSGYTFNGWKFSFTEDPTTLAGPYTTMTDELLTALNGKSNITAEPQFTVISGGIIIGPIGGGGGNKDDKDDETVNPFTDVAETDYFYDAVLWAVENGITNGVTETTFEPGANCTRGQMVTFLWRAAGCPEPKTAAHPFADVATDAYYYKAVLWAVENGITNGVAADSFAPDAACNRGQMATFLWRAEGKATSGKANIFTDVQTDAYYYDAVLWALENGITNGISDTAFGPADSCTRGQMVTFLYRNAKVEK